MSTLDRFESVFNAAAREVFAQQAVETYHWLTPAEMLDGLGLAETTPGPLVLVLQFVGFLAGARAQQQTKPPR